MGRGDTLGYSCARICSVVESHEGVPSVQHDAACGMGVTCALVTEGDGHLAMIDSTKEQTGGRVEGVRI